MEAINLNNYQAYFLDFVEGKLNGEQLKLLKKFLLLHPDLQQELDEFENILLEPEAEPYPFNFSNILQKDFLSDEVLIAYTEGLLTDSDQRNIQHAAAENKTLKSELELYSISKVEADLAVQFPHKNNLYHFGEEELIASIEGQLNLTEQAALTSQTLKNKTLLAEINSYKRTVSFPDKTITYPEKSELKRGATVISLASYWKPLSIAASIVFIILLVLFYTSNSTKSKMAESKKIDKKEIPQQDFSNKSNNNTNPQQIQSVLPLTKQKRIKEKSNGNTSNLVFVKDTLHYLEEIPFANNRNEIIQKDSLIPNNAKLFASENVSEYFEENETNESITLKDFVTQKLKTSAWDAENTSTKELVKKDRKLRGMDLLAFVAKGLQKLGSKKSAAKVEYNNNTEVTAYQLNIAGLSISKKIN